jgi:phosphoribosylglycinamide formyltransferase-1
MKRLVILISGRGSNMEAIVNACSAERWPAEVAAVISNRPDAGIATAVVDHKAYGSREDFDAELARVIDGFAPDLVVLAGFMRILTPAFTARYARRMLNIHPSLLPAFTGLHTHERALEMGCKVAGVTVHFVTAELDHGAIVIQAAVPVLPRDDAKALSARVLAAEHRIYPQAVRWFVEDALVWAGEIVHHRDAAPQQLLLG